MNQKPKNELLSVYFDDEATPDEAALAEELLYTSESARKEFEDIRELSERLRSLPRETMPDESACMVMKQAERESLLVSVPTRPSTRSPWRTWTLAACGLVTAAATFLTMTHFLITPGTNDVVVTNERPVTPETPFEVADADEISATIGFAKSSDSPSEPDVRENESLEAIDFSTVKIGDIISYLDRSGDRVAVIKLAVVDVTKAVGQIRVLLSNNSIPELVAASSNSLIAPEAVDRSNELRTVYVESTQPQLVSALMQMRNNKIFVDLALAPAVALNRFVTTGIDAPNTSQPDSVPGAPTKLSESQTLEQAIVQAKKLRQAPMQKLAPKAFAESAAAGKSEKKTASAADSFQLHVNLRTKVMKRESRVQPSRAAIKERTDTPRRRKVERTGKKRTELVRVFFVFEQRPNANLP